MAQERASPRTKTFVTGQIIGADGTSPVDCFVKDLSEGGAKLEVGDGCTVPPAFQLKIPQLDMAFQAETRWRYAHLIGVKFTAPVKPTRSEISPTRAELLAENAALRETVRSLAERLTQLGEPVMISLSQRTAGEAAVSGPAPAYASTRCWADWMR